MASATSFSSTTTTSSSQCSTSGRVSSPGSFTAMPSAGVITWTVRDALAGVQRAAGDLNADDFDLRVVALQRDGQCRRRARRRRGARRPAGRPGHRRRPRCRSSPGRRSRQDRRRDGRTPCRLRRTGACRCAMASVSGAPPAAITVARTAACLHLRQRCPGGDEDLARHAAVAGGEREGLGVVASAPGDDTATGTATQIVELRQRAPAETIRPLEVLRLEHDRAAASSAERPRRCHGCVLHDAALRERRPFDSFRFDLRDRHPIAYRNGDARPARRQRCRCRRRVRR